MDTGSRRSQLLLLLVLGLLFALPLGWYTKNQVQHGFFGGSSWYGMGMWRTALFRQDTAILPPLLEAGVFEAVVLEEPFSPPSAYRGLGYDRSSSIAVLANNDQHNVNVPDISGAYRTSALGLMRRTPGRYVRNVVTAYGNFLAPSTDFAHLADNPGRVFTRDQLLQDVWGFEYSGDTRTVDVHVRWLRLKIEEDPAKPRLLGTVRGVGYRFNL